MSSRIFNLNKKTKFTKSKLHTITNRFWIYNLFKYALELLLITHINSMFYINHKALTRNFLWKENTNQDISK
ncbi:hypothetical protein HYE15_00835 [Mycoplasmopsis bovis]|nr:hypothetical protein [Mycoplasmopsis bovis]QQH25498.1 hypothetical protein HYE15_00835 [Mycoplasmopsis bovis]